MRFRPAPALAMATVLLIGCTVLIPPKRDVREFEINSVQGMPLKITYVSLPGPAAPTVLSSVSFSNGAVWSVAGMYSINKTIRVDASTLDVSVIDRPFDTFDLMVDANSIWLSKLTPLFGGGGDLHRYDIDTHQLLVTIPDAGSPFALIEDLLFAYHQGTGIISAIDLQTNQVKWKMIGPEKAFPRHIAYADGSIWQFSYVEKMSQFQTIYQMQKQVAAAAVVRRIDLQNGQVIAEIPIGLSQADAGIYFVAGDIWVLGDRRVYSGGFATRIDVKSNRVIATIDLSAPPYPPRAPKALPQTPVYWDGGVWLSTYYTSRGRMPGLLKKIDLDANEVADQIGLSAFDLPNPSQPMLVAGDDALWAVGDKSVLKIEAIK